MEPCVVFAEIGTSKLQDRLHEVQEWVAPLKKVTSFDEECIPELVSQLKAHSDDALDLPKGLAITLRIMRHLAVPPRTRYAVEGEQYTSALHLSVHVRRL